MLAWSLRMPRPANLVTWLGPRPPLGKKACEAHAISAIRQAALNRLSKAHQGKVGESSSTNMVSLAMTKLRPSNYG
ncbi:hypothetical protein ON010_g3905 [Phytophthora cinnamomi]|nr:hypothetical protein ON010_g3905 [Phytophthora cinnamomi]